jgi:hypothetical protein
MLGARAVWRRFALQTAQTRQTAGCLAEPDCSFLRNCSKLRQPARNAEIRQTAGCLAAGCSAREQSGTTLRARLQKIARLLKNGSPDSRLSGGAEQSGAHNAPDCRLRRQTAAYGARLPVFRQTAGCLAVFASLLLK